MPKFEFDLDAAIRSARKQVADETAEHQKRVEFWTGYITAMEEVQRPDETAEHQKRVEFWTGYITAMEEVQRHESA